MNFDFSSAGIKKGIIKGLTVFVWVAGSGVVTALIAYVSNYDVTNANVTVVALVAVANSILAGLQRWLDTTKADDKFTVSKIATRG